MHMTATLYIYTYFFWEFKCFHTSTLLYHFRWQPVTFPGTERLHWGGSGLEPGTAALQSGALFMTTALLMHHHVCKEAAMVLVSQALQASMPLIRMTDQKLKARRLAQFYNIPA